MKLCCVIGGCGFIGRHLVELLLQTGRQVRVIDTLPAAAAGFAPQVEYLRNPGADKDFLKKALKAADEVVDLAYATVPKTSFDEPLRDIRSNLPFGLELFQAAGNSSVRKLIVLSSGGTVYGEPLKLPISELHPTNPVSPYGITKLAMEKYALMFHHLNALPVVILRPGNAFGEGQRAFSGQGFVATAMASFLQGKAVTVFGRHGTVRDYVYVKDIASGIVAVLAKGKVGACYNLGSGRGYTNRQVLEAIVPLARKAGLKPKIVFAAARKFDVSANILDSSKLATATGWKARTAFKEGVASTWAWFLQNCK